MIIVPYKVNALVCLLKGSSYGEKKEDRFERQVGIARKLTRYCRHFFSKMYSRMPNIQDPIMESALKDHFARVPMHSSALRYPLDESLYRLPPVSLPLADPALRNIPLSVPDPVLRHTHGPLSPPPQPIRSPPPTVQHPLTQISHQPIRSPPPTVQHPLTQISAQPIQSPPPIVHHVLSQIPPQPIRSPPATVQQQLTQVSLHSLMPGYEEPRSVMSRFLDDVSNSVAVTAASQSSEMPTHILPQTQPSHGETAATGTVHLENDLEGYDEDEPGPLPSTDGNFDKYVEERLEKGCGCSMQCFSKFPFQAIYDHILDVREMGKYERDLYVMGALSEVEVDDGDESTQDIQRTLRPRVRQDFQHCGEKVCRPTFMMLYDINKNTLESLKKIVVTTGVLQRTGNHTATSDKVEDDHLDGNVPHKKLKLEDGVINKSDMSNMYMPGQSASSHSFSSPVATTSAAQGQDKSSSLLHDQVSVVLNEIDQLEKQEMNGASTTDPMVNPTESERFHCKVKKGCGCKLDCLRRFPPSVIYGHILDLREMSRVEKEIYILVALSQADEDFEETTKKGTKRQRVSHSYWHMGNRVCRYTFMLIYDLGKHCLENLQKHLATKGIVPRIHASKGKKPWHAVTEDDIKRVCNFVNNFTEIVGSPQPGAPKVGPDNHTLIMLPIGTRKKDTWKRYTERCTELGVRALKYSTFITIWNNMLPHIKCPEPEKSPQTKREIKPSPTMVPHPTSIDPTMYDNRKMDPVINMQMFERKFDQSMYERKFDPNIPVYDRKL